MTARCGILSWKGSSLCFNQMLHGLEWSTEVVLWLCKSHYQSKSRLSPSPIKDQLQATYKMPKVFWQWLWWPLVCFLIVHYMCCITSRTCTSHFFETSCITTAPPLLHNIITLSSLMPVLVETVSVEMDLVTSSLLHSEVTSDTGCILVPWSTHLVQSRRKVKHVISKYIHIYTHIHVSIVSFLSQEGTQSKSKWCWRFTTILWKCRIYNITYCKLHMWGVFKETLSVELHRAFKNSCS